MYILIDMEDMVVRHKHPDHSTVSSLAKIELSHCKAKVIPVELAAISTLTDMEVRLLHSHVTGTKIGPAAFHSLTRELFAVLQAIPDSDVNVFEVKHQASQIPLSDSGFYRYVKGAYKAQKVEDLFLPAAIDVTTPARAPAAPSPVVQAPVQAAKTVPQQPQTPSVLPSWHPANKHG